MTDIKKYLFFNKFINKNQRDIILEQNELAIEYNINSLKNEIIRKYGEISGR